MHWMCVILTPYSIIIIKYRICEFGVHLVAPNTYSQNLLSISISLPKLVRCIMVGNNHILGLHYIFTVNVDDEHYYICASKDKPCARQERNYIGKTMVYKSLIGNMSCSILPICKSPVKHNQMVTFHIVFMILDILTALQFKAWMTRWLALCEQVAKLLKGEEWVFLLCEVF